MTLIAHPPDAAADDSEAERWVRLESEAASLRAGRTFHYESEVTRRDIHDAGRDVSTGLFVDDDRDLLDSLRARLYKHRHDWNMKFVVSGAEAIAAFEQQHVDLVVSDVRMPGMDGGQLLTTVKQRWPTTARIIVSWPCSRGRLSRPER
jgi:PleD family two-component response regulator